MCNVFFKHCRRTTLFYSYTRHHDTLLHLLGGLEGTGGLSIVGVINRTVQTLTPDWVIVHIVDNEQVQLLLNIGVASPCRMSMPFIWSPAWYAQQISVRQAPRQIGKCLLQATAVDVCGEISYISRYGGVE